MSQSSPEYLQISLAAAMTLGLRPGRFFREAKLHCLNLLLTYPQGCAANCSYCGLARERRHRNAERSFIRVEWPLASLDEIIGRASKRQDLERVCLSMIMHHRALDDTLLLCRRLTAELKLPLSVLVNPSTLVPGSLARIKAAGAQMATVALDAAQAELFAAHRGSGVAGPHRWQRYWQALEEAALTFRAGKFGAHLIVGLGETESQMLATIQRVHSLGGRTHLFSFYPEEGSRLETAAPCPVSQFRRVQLGRYLIDHELSSWGEMRFDEHGRVSAFGLRGAVLDALVETGEPFRTSGCPGKSRSCACNRPFGDGPPSDIRSFPFRPEAADLQTIRKQLATYQELLTLIN